MVRVKMEQDKVYEAQSEVIPDWLPMYYMDIPLQTDLSVELPHNWPAVIHNAVDKYAKKTILTGDSETSFEENARLRVDVLEGDVIKQKLPWLFELYHHDFLTFVRNKFNRDIYASNEQNTAININKISGLGARYEWHVDTNCVTGLLYVDDLPEHLGGGLIFKKGDKSFSLQPKRGRFYCFLTKDLPHSVAPLQQAGIERLSIPMNYYFDANNKGRDPKVHQYLTQV